MKYERIPVWMGRAGCDVTEGHVKASDIERVVLETVDEVLHRAHQLGTSGPIELRLWTAIGLVRDKKPEEGAGAVATPQEATPDLAGTGHPRGVLMWCGGREVMVPFATPVRDCFNSTPTPEATVPEKEPDPEEEAHIAEVMRPPSKEETFREVVGELMDELKTRSTVGWPDCDCGFCKAFAKVKAMLEARM